MLFHVLHLLTCPSRKGCIEQLFQEGWSLPLSVCVRVTVFDPAVTSGTITGPWMLKWVRQSLQCLNERRQVDGNQISIQQQYWQQKCGMSWEPPHQLHIFVFLSCLIKTSLRVICATQETRAHVWTPAVVTLWCIATDRCCSTPL